MNLKSILKISLLLVFLFAFQGIGHAQSYKGFIYDDVPATLEIQSTSKAGQYKLIITVIGNEDNAWVFEAEYDYNYDKSRERYFGNDGAETGMFLYDVSEDAGQEKGIILSGYTYSPEDNYEIRKMIFFSN